MTIFGAPKYVPKLAKYDKEAKEGPLRMTNCRTSEDSYSAHGKCGRLRLAKEQTITKLTRNLFPVLELDALSCKQKNPSSFKKSLLTDDCSPFYCRNMILSLLGNTRSLFLNDFIAGCLLRILFLNFSSLYHKV